MSPEGPQETRADENPYPSRNALHYLILVPRPLDPSPPQLSKEEWVSVLKLSTVWQMDQARFFISYMPVPFLITSRPQIRAMAIQRLSRMDLQPLDKIVMAREFCVSKWLSEGAMALVETLDGFEVGSVAQVLGWETTARLYSLQSVSHQKLFEKELVWLTGILHDSVHIKRLQCIGCGQAPTSNQALLNGCACGGHKYQEWGNPYGHAFVARSVPGFRIVGEACSLMPSSKSVEDHESAISETVASIFGAEIKAMEVAV
ncbi:hypothetical protein BKA70DRAFT_1280072 [Coprinopsis sp. MPI-PUGE-AT-0042]|nr:hypothetical protein BKA70DRAFT_1280072 [Coprinopsis sp. MPI-PUGE-AT-0042]